MGYLNGLFVLARSIGLIGELLFDTGCCNTGESSASAPSVLHLCMTSGGSWARCLCRARASTPSLPLPPSTHAAGVPLCRPCCLLCPLRPLSPSAGHALDQKRLQQPLFRYPWDEVLYTK